ncbi:MAG: phosphoenolpyruvate--protein phosphotransferase [Mycobacterium leprae]
MFTGIAASPGIAIGRAFVLRPEAEATAQPYEPGDASTEQGRFEAAVAASRTELEALRERVARRVGEKEAEVFDAHLLMLDDPSLVDEVLGAIAGGTDALSAVETVTEALAGMLAALDDPYMKERATDIRDVGRRMVRHLKGVSAPDLSALSEPSVVVAHDLTPSDTAQLDPATALGFATESGGRTSHSAIMARSLGLPAVVGAPGLLETVKDGDLLVVDGATGKVLVNPEAGELAEYQTKAKQYAEERAGLAALKEQPAVTTDGHRIELVANVGNPRDVGPALEGGAEGVGLYRTEFLFMDRDRMPTEDEQFDAYKAVVEGMGGHPVIIRTLDIGGDKQIPYLEMPQEMNPFLGWRALRMCLDRPDLFKTQLRAILRASAFGQCLVMFPMVSSIDEVRRAKAILAEATAELKAEGKSFDAAMKVGVMIEIPSAALIADQMAREVDFFSIGSNDLIQYTMAVDRMNQRIANLYDPLHPGVLRLIAMVIDAAHKHGRFAGMCGEMAGDTSATPILLGLGLDEFSMSAGSVPQVKKLVRQLSKEQCAAVARKALECGTSAEVKELLAGIGR